MVVAALLNAACAAYQADGRVQNHILVPRDAVGSPGARGPSWRLYAALQDPETTRELSQVCGEHGVMASSKGSTRGPSGRRGRAPSRSSGHSASRSEMRCLLIKPGELLQDTRADEAFVIVIVLVIFRCAKPLRCGRVIPGWCRNQTLSAFPR